jgi:hypothetical protein
MQKEMTSDIVAHVQADALSSGFRGPFSLVGRVLDAVKLRKANVSAADKDKLKAAALEAYDVACRAIDIPLLPDAQEVSLEAWLRELLSAQIDKLLALA